MRLLVGACLMTVLGAGGSGSSGQEERVVEGKPLSGWIQALGDEDPKVRQRAAEALGRAGAVAVPALIEALEDERRRGGAIEALREMGPEARGAVPALIRLLGEKPVNQRAAVALAVIGPEARAAVPSLLQSLRAERGDAFEFAYALVAIDRSTAPSAMPVLIRELACGAASHRMLAAHSLGEIGPPAKGAVPALQQALRDGARDVRVRAAVALVAIDPVVGRDVVAHSWRV